MDMLPLHEEGNQPEVRATSLGGHQHAKQQVCFSQLPVCADGQDTLEHRPKTVPPHGLANGLTEQEAWNMATGQLVSRTPHCWSGYPAPMRSCGAPDPAVPNVMSEAEHHLSQRRGSLLQCTQTARKAKNKAGKGGGGARGGGGGGVPLDCFQVTATMLHWNTHNSTDNQEMLVGEICSSPFLVQHHFLMPDSQA